MTKYFTGAKTIEELRKKYRELLKSIGFKYAPKKKSWCWHYGDYNRYHKKEISLDGISQKVLTDSLRSMEEVRVQTFVSTPALSL